jgi:hypothetical protein
MLAMGSLTVYAANATFNVYFTGQTLTWQKASENVPKNTTCNYAYLQITSANHPDAQCTYRIASTNDGIMIAPTITLANSNRNVNLLSYYDVGRTFVGNTDLWVYPTVFEGPTVTVSGQWNPYVAQ